MNKRQKDLKQQLNIQPSLCSCGFPIPPMNITMLEGWLGAKQIYKEHEYICSKCKEKHIRIG